MSSKTDNHTFYFMAVPVEEYQLKQVFDKAVLEGSKLVPKLEKGYQINMVKNRDGEYLNHGYVRFDDSRMFHMLNGCNPDGSARFEMKDASPTAASPVALTPKTPKSTASSKDSKASFDMSMIGHISAASPVPKFNWADESEDNDTISMPVSPKLTKVILPPLLVVCEYQYNKEQLADVMEYHKGRGLTGEIQKSGKIRLSPSTVKDVDEKYLPHVICARFVPSTVSIKHLESIFNKYANAKTGKVKVPKSNKFVDVKYPQIKLDSKVATIAFKPGTFDAQYALLMNHKVKIGKDTLIFHHSNQA